MSMEIPETNLNDVLEMIIADYRSFHPMQSLIPLIHLFRLVPPEDYDSSSPNLSPFDKIVWDSLVYPEVFALFESFALQVDLGKIIEAVVKIGYKEAEGKQ